METEIARLDKMGGEQTKNLNVRISEALRDRFKLALHTPDDAPAVDGAPVVRWLLEPFCEFTEKHDRRPNSFAELATWHLARIESAKAAKK